MMRGTAFGGGAADDAAAEGASASEQSDALSARRREASKKACPSGVSCVGCALHNRISAVDRFIRANIGKMTEDSLWKLAALTYQRDVVEPAKAEGAPVPPWGWKDVRNHYEIHSMSNLIHRHKQLRTLQGARVQLDAALMRNEGGRRELDRANMTLMVNVIKEGQAPRHARRVDERRKEAWLRRRPDGHGSGGEGREGERSVVGRGVR